MADIRETDVSRAPDGRVCGYSERIERPKAAGGGFGWGVLLGGLIIAVAIIAFAYTQGSFQSAGVDADRATAQAEEQIGVTAEAAGDRINQATNTLQEQTQN